MTNKFPAFALAALAGLFALPAFAQSTNWKVDSAHSAAQISVEDKTSAGVITLLLGGAGVSGSLHIDNADVSKSTAEFTVYPVGSSQTASESQADSTQSTLLSFRSEKASWTRDGMLQVTGTLTVTHVERYGELNGNEAYSGPADEDLIISQATREESFVFAIPSSDPEDSNGNATTDVATSLSIHREDFPELLNAVLSTNWPAAAQDKNCQAPTSTSEDYSGALCTGSQVIVPSNTRTAVTASEDYPNNADSAEAGNVVTVALRLHLAQDATALAVKTGGQ